MKAPLEYTTKANQHITPAPPKPIHMAIVGPPKSGKSTLAKRFAAELGLMKISPTDIVELLLSKYSKALISQQIQAELIEGMDQTCHPQSRVAETRLLNIFDP